MRAKADNGMTARGILEDYAFVAQGLLSYWQLTEDDRDKQALESLLNTAWQRFYGEQGWLLSEKMLLRYGGNETHIVDGPLPSPSATLIATTLRFANLTSNDSFRKQALKAMNIDYEMVISDSLWHATLVQTALSEQGLIPTK